MQISFGNALAFVVRAGLVALALSMLLVLPSGCKTTGSADTVNTFFAPLKMTDRGKQSAGKLLAAINKRNIQVEDDQQWIKRSYQNIMIRNLTDIPKGEYASYKKYSDKYDRVYMVVHPSYYTFFMGDISRNVEKIQHGGYYPEKNFVERLYDKISIHDYVLRVMQEQERMLRDFIEVYSTRRQLIVLIVPGGYQEHLKYGYQEGFDEYARYINEISNESASVLYMESLDWNHGELKPQDMETLVSFLDELEIKTVVLGGGYIGRCLEGFYNHLAENFGYDHVFQAPEIIAVSPDDIKGDWGNNLLTDKGRLNIKQWSKNLVTPYAYDTKRTIPRIKRYYAYRYNLEK